MVLNAGDKLFLLAGLLATLAAPLRTQEPSVSVPTQANSPEVAADGAADGIYISLKPGEPFTARADGTLWEKARDLSGPTTKRLLSMVARDSSGRIYLENRRAYTLPPLDTVAPVVETFPPLESAAFIRLPVVGSLRQFI